MKAPKASYEIKVKEDEYEGYLVLAPVVACSGVGNRHQCVWNDASG
ncbi:hypothetical protein HCH_05949 [Hahella chejuensis KCTC 2396]|uniref:Uncharacterized protein n=1 Tax=Hahella chejuensis (strain KCTC 2396) TaxID=349521 RepID=Q2S9S4_HAHCH|nr:hypothetical protein HCH_05949 [Hahella chejuensis KCTC 2396]